MDPTPFAVAWLARYRADDAPVFDRLLACYFAASSELHPLRQRSFCL